MDEWRRILDERCTAAALPPALRDLVQHELDEHFQDRADDLRAGGLSADAVAAALRAELPSVEAIAQLATTRRQPRPHAPASAAAGPRGGLVEALDLARRDVAFAFRTFARDRTFTVAAVITLALCLAANVIVFTLVQAVLLDAVAAPEPAALVHIGNLYPNAGVATVGGANAGVPDYFDRRAAVPALAEQALLRVEGLSAGDDAAERIIGLRATPTVFPMLRAQAAIGRVFVDDDGDEGREQKVILSDGLWRRRFAADPSAVGRTLAIGGVPHEIVGVMPAGFRFYDDEVEVWVPAAFSAEERSDAERHSNSWTHVGRLAPGATVAQVQAQLDALNAANLERFPALRQVLVEAGFRSAATPLVDVLVAEVRRPLLLLWGGVACVLLIGVVNLAALTLARATSRRAEIATRIALGAEVGRVRMQLVTEHAVLAVLGGAGGLAIAWAVLRGVPGAGLALVPDGREVTLAPAVWAYAAALVVAVGLVLGLVAMRVVEPGRTASVLRDEGRSRAGSRTARRVRQGLVVAQVAVACMLLVGAGVLLASFRRLLAVDTGFRTAVVTGAVSLPRAAYPSDAERLAFVDRLLADVRALPGVRAAGATTNIPFGTSRGDSVVWPEGWTPQPGQSFVSPYQIRVTPGYFGAMGIPLLAGRDFDGADVEGATPVAIVDERLAARFWPDQDPIGRVLLQPTTPDALSNPTPDNVQRFRVVGVARTIKQYALVAPADLIGTYYFPFAQSVPGAFTLAVDSAAGAATVSADLRRAVTAIDPRLPLFDVQVMHERVRDSLRARQATMTLAVAFGTLALGLSAVGLYGVLAYLVAQRTREIGIRMALGGTAPAIAGLVLRESVTVVALGLALGLAGAAALGRALSSEVYEVQPLDPATVASAVALLLAAALAATAAPARRALRVDPAVTLAAE